jgi:hypothetical protein
MAVLNKDAQNAVDGGGIGPHGMLRAMAPGRYVNRAGTATKRLSPSSVHFDLLVVTAVLVLG